MGDEDDVVQTEKKSVRNSQSLGLEGSSRESSQERSSRADDGHDALNSSCSRSSIKASILRTHKMNDSIGTDPDLQLSTRDECNDSASDEDDSIEITLQLSVSLAAGGEEPRRVTLEVTKDMKVLEAKEALEEMWTDIGAVVMVPFQRWFTLHMGLGRAGSSRNLGRPDIGDRATAGWRGGCTSTS